MNFLKTRSVKAPKAPTIRDPDPKTRSIGPQKSWNSSKELVNVLAKTAKTPILTGIIIKAVTGLAAP